MTRTMAPCFRQRFYQNKPPTILDVPVEHAMGGGGYSRSGDSGRCARRRRASGGWRLCAILNALSDALGDEIFRRAPVNADTILTSLEAGRPMQHPLMAHI